MHHELANLGTTALKVDGRVTFVRRDLEPVGSNVTKWCAGTLRPDLHAGVTEGGSVDVVVAEPERGGGGFCRTLDLASLPWIVTPEAFIGVTSTRLRAYIVLLSSISRAPNWMPISMLPLPTLSDSAPSASTTLVLRCSVLSAGGPCTAPDPANSCTIPFVTRSVEPFTVTSSAAVTVIIDSPTKLDDSMTVAPDQESATASKASTVLPLTFTPCRPVAHVQPLGGAAAGRVGFLPEALAKETLVPDDFNSMGARQIAELFGANR